MADQGILDVKAVREIVEDYGKAILSARGQAMTRVMNILEAQAVELAPVDIGNLEASTVVQIREVGQVNRKIVGTLAFVTPYAARQHELPEDARGPKTQAKAGNEFGQAGPKYLERPLRQMQKDFLKIIGKELKDKL